jgi:hypothetical protein
VKNMMQRWPLWVDEEWRGLLRDALFKICAAYRYPDKAWMFLPRHFGRMVTVTVKKP